MIKGIIYFLGAIISAAVLYFIYDYYTPIVQIVCACAFAVCVTLFIRWCAIDLYNKMYGRKK